MARWRGCASITRTYVKPGDAILHAGKPQLKKLTQGIGNVPSSSFITWLLYASNPFKGTFLLQQKGFIIQRSLSDMLRQLVLERTFIQHLQITLVGY